MISDLRCPVCLTPLDPAVLERSGASRLYQCPGCDLQVWEPRTNPGGQWYDADDLYLACPVVDWLGWYHGVGLKAMQPDARTLLDVGCADGRFVYAAARRGIDARGIDISQRLVSLGNERYGGDRLSCVRLEDYLARRPNPVDVLTLFEVIEHVESPLEFLTTALRAVRPGGQVIISTPNRHGYPRPPKGYDEPPHHLTRWSPDALRYLAQATAIERSRVAICPTEVAIKAYLLGTLRFGIIVGLLRRRARASGRATGSAGRPQGTSHIRHLIRAKDLAAAAAAKIAAPILRPWFPGPAMVLLGHAGMPACLERS